MDVSAQDAINSAMWRFHNAALERAVLIYTFCRSTLEETPGGNFIHHRQLAMFTDYIHDFAFNARRAIERANKYNPGLIDRLQQIRINGGKTQVELSEFDNPKSYPVTDRSFWWILGRIIHSKEVFIIYKTVDIIINNKTTGSHHSVMQPLAFGVSSDWDSNKIEHYVELESFVAIYVGAVATEIDFAINIRNNPAINSKFECQQ